MKTILICLCLVSGLFAFDYANNISYHNFKYKELTRINDIDYELSTMAVDSDEQNNLKKS